LRRPEARGENAPAAEIQRLFLFSRIFATQIIFQPYAAKGNRPDLEWELLHRAELKNDTLRGARCPSIPARPLRKPKIIKQLEQAIEKACRVVR
jgi:hypothetical protein